MCLILRLEFLHIAYPLDLLRMRRYLNDSLRQHNAESHLPASVLKRRWGIWVPKQRFIGE